MVINPKNYLRHPVKLKLNDESWNLLVSVSIIQLGRKFIGAHLHTSDFKHKGLIKVTGNKILRARVSFTRGHSHSSGSQVESNKSQPYSNGSFIETALPTNNNQCYFQFQHSNAILGNVAAVQVFKYTRNKAQSIKMLLDFAMKYSLARRSLRYIGLLQFPSGRNVNFSVVLNRSINGAFAHTPWKEIFVIYQIVVGSSHIKTLLSKINTSTLCAGFLSST